MTLMTFSESQGRLIDMSDKVKLGLAEDTVLRSFIDDQNSKFEDTYKIRIDSCDSSLKTETNKAIKSGYIRFEYMFKTDKEGTDRTFHAKIECPNDSCIKPSVDYANFWEKLSDEYETEFTAEVLRTYATTEDYDNVFGKKKEAI